MSKVSSEAAAHDVQWTSALRGPKRSGDKALKARFANGAAEL